MSSAPDQLSTVDIDAAARQAAAGAEASAPETVKDERSSILFCCPGSVLEITSGAALSLRVDERDIGFEPSTPLAEGLERWTRWYVDYRNQ